jgi:hypothetical protein
MLIVFLYIYTHKINKYIYCDIFLILDIEDQIQFIVDINQCD